jgi:hypothetical protein
MSIITDEPTPPITFVGKNADKYKDVITKLHAAAVNPGKEFTEKYFRGYVTALPLFEKLSVGVPGCHSVIRTFSLAVLEGQEVQILDPVESKNTVTAFEAVPQAQFWTLQCRMVMGQIKGKMLMKMENTVHCLVPDNMIVPEDTPAVDVLPELV